MKLNSKGAGIIKDHLGVQRLVVEEVICQSNKNAFLGIVPSF